MVSCELKKVEKKYISLFLSSHLSLTPIFSLALYSHSLTHSLNLSLSLFLFYTLFTFSATPSLIHFFSDAVFCEDEE